MLIVGIWLLAAVERTEVYSGDEVHRLDVVPLNSKVTLRSLVWKWVYIISAEGEYIEWVAHTKWEGILKAEFGLFWDTGRGKKTRVNTK